MSPAPKRGDFGVSNLGRLVTGETPNTDLDWHTFRDVIYDAVHFLDNVITQNTYPLEAVRVMTEANRKTGVGLMGFADLLLRMGIPYSSGDAVEMAARISEFLDYHSKRTSVDLARERGPFPNFSNSVYMRGDYLTQKYQGVSAGMIGDKDWEALDRDIRSHGLRNATTVSLAPTGTISIIAGASGGIEPLFALAFVRNIMDNTHLHEVHPHLEKTLRERGLYSEALMNKVLRLGRIGDLLELPDELRRLYVTAHEITPEEHLRMQAAFQKHCDNAVSKTVNFPESARPEDIRKAYELAASLQLKGVTVYRDNCRALQPINIERVRSVASCHIDAHHCPDCGKPLQLVEGCYQCRACHYTCCG